MSEETDNHLRLVLNVKIDYELNGTDPEELRQNLATIVQYAHGAGMITGDSEATIDEIDWHVEGRDRPRQEDGTQSPAAIIAWLQRQADDEVIFIDDGGLCLCAMESEGYLEIGGHTPDDEEE